MVVVGVALDVLVGACLARVRVEQACLVVDHLPYLVFQKSFISTLPARS